MDIESLKFHTIVDKPWGQELIFTSAESPFTGKIISVRAKQRLSLQYHDKKEESLCLIQGQAFLWIGEDKDSLQKIEMQNRIGYRIKPMLLHRIEAITDCAVIEASQSEIGTTFRLEDDYHRLDETEELRKEPNRGWQE